MSLPPMFIGGAGRSGTTLLADLMGCHPEISPVYETYFLGDFALLFLAQDRPPMEVACKRAIEVMDRWSRELPHRPHNKAAHERYAHGPHYLLFSREEAMSAAVECVQRIRGGGHPAKAIGAMSRRLFASHARVDNKRAWVNKTPANLQLLPELTAAFGPQIRFIHILRDPRDVACSVVERPWGPSSHSEAAAWWASKIRRGLEYARSHRVPYMEVRFEDLVERPEPVLNRIFEFVGALPQARLAIANQSQGRTPFDASRVGRWRRDFPTQERGDFYRSCGQLMEAVGYRWAA